MGVLCLLEVWDSLLVKAACALGCEGFNMRLVKGEWDKRKTKLSVSCVSFWVLYKSLTESSSGRLMAKSILTAPADRR